MKNNRPYSPLSWLWYLTVGYGYRTWQGPHMGRGHGRHRLAGIQRCLPRSHDRAGPAPPAFQPVFYTLDRIIPGIGLGQKSAWQPATSALLYWSWALSITGSVLSAAVVAGLTGILKRD